MKVTLLSTSFPLTTESSSGIFVARLADRLAEMMSVVIVVPADAGTIGKQRRGNILLIPCRYAPRRWRLLAHSPGGLPVTLRKHRALWLLVPALLFSLAWQCLRQAWSSDVLHANWVISGCVAGAVGFFTGKPVLTTVRGEDVTRAIKSPVDRLLLRLCMMTSRRVVCVSSDMLSWLRAHMPAYKHKLLLIENGVDEEFFRAAENREKQAAGESIRLITVGSLIPRKGIDQIIRVLARLAPSCRPHIEIVGGGPEEASLRELAQELKVGEQVDFLGPLMPQEIPARLSDADIFLFASHSEGRPNAVVEAMAAGLPVIAAEIAGVKELIEHERTGLLFTDGNLEQFAKYLQSLIIDQDLREQLGRAGREQLLDKGCTWQDCARNYFQAYQQMIHG